MGSNPHMSRLFECVDFMADKGIGIGILKCWEQNYDFDIFRDRFVITQWFRKSIKIKINSPWFSLLDLISAPSLLLFKSMKNFTSKRERSDSYAMPVLRLLFDDVII